METRANSSTNQALECEQTPAFMWGKLYDIYHCLMKEREGDLVSEWIDGHTSYIKDALTILKNGHQNLDWEAEEGFISR